VPLLFKSNLPTIDCSAETGSCPPVGGSTGVYLNESVVLDVKSEEMSLNIVLIIAIVMAFSRSLFLLRMSFLDIFCV
jgi:hypothetical protein